MSAPIAPEFRDPVVPWRLLEDYRPLAGVYDEVSGAGGPAASALRDAGPIARRPGPPRAVVALGGRQARDSRQRRDLQRLRRSAGRRSAVDAGHDAAAHRAGGVEPHRRRAAAAIAAAQSDPRGSVRPAASAPRRRAAAVARAREPGVSAAVSRRARAERRVRAPARRGSRRGRRTVSGGCSPIARRRRRAPATRWRIASCCRAACRRPFATVTCSGSARSSARIATA